MEVSETFNFFFFSCQNIKVKSFLMIKMQTVHFLQPLSRDNEYFIVGYNSANINSYHCTYSKRVRVSKHENASTLQRMN